MKNGTPGPIPICVPSSKGLSTHFWLPRKWIDISHFIVSTFVSVNTSIEITGEGRENAEKVERTQKRSRERRKGRENAESAEKGPS
ncbi:hypothetical protein EAF00_011149 [Botryotinia globosa]|nr:hypothetical protein EAF00_011149 [Botryotinia globosa]